MGQSREAEAGRCVSEDRRCSDAGGRCFLRGGTTSVLLLDEWQCEGGCRTARATWRVGQRQGSSGVLLAAAAAGERRHPLTPLASS